MPSITNLSKAKSTTHKMDPRDIIADHRFNGRWEDEPRPDDLITGLLTEGQLQAVGIRPAADADSNPRLVFGFRRWLAAMTIMREQLGGYSDKKPFLLECKISTAETDKEAFLLNIAENMRRTDRSVIDDAHNMHRLKTEYDMTLEEIAQLYGLKSASGVANRLKMLELSPTIQRAVHTGKMPMVKALSLVGADDVTVNEALTGDKDLTAPELERRAIERANSKNDATAPAKEKGRGRPRKDPNSRVKTLKDVRQLASLWSADDTAQLSMLGSLFTAWLDGKSSDKSLRTKIVRLVAATD